MFPVQLSRTWGTQRRVTRPNWFIDPLVLKNCSAKKIDTIIWSSRARYCNPCKELLVVGYCHSLDHRSPCACFLLGYISIVVRIGRPCLNTEVYFAGCLYYLKVMVLFLYGAASWYFSSVARLLKIPGRRRRASDLEEFSAHFSYHLPDLQKTKIAFEKDAPGNQEKWLKQREKWCKQIEKVTDSAAPSWFYIDWYMNLVGGWVWYLVCEET